MSNVVGPKLYTSPHGAHQMRIYPHGYCEPASDMTAEEIEMIEEFSRIALSLPEAEGRPDKAFELMGWTCV